MVRGRGEYRERGTERKKGRYRGTEKENYRERDSAYKKQLFLKLEFLASGGAI